ncbi:NAD(P)-dependent oxidoreductase [Pseudomonas chengduensis]|uniref:3-hydroxyisobutyrate dehydrogenase n=1 Tax=Ectopseudomonas chengduensis TaxID=489632 RepID=A0A1G6IVE9_9GAMM|nr:NAD(P)-dependent oxidoreductase [Pseudomonas chengduensis]MBP3059986.1 NAD-binding protein [Pseudomonas chengduensis]MDH0956567.1 NAD(P)-dependent oxidoreductase [Pseudomonas chengduensis]MDH1534563.1 NAD(P)-dependent oxidoreductase [Pseudomonas chengduensis]NNB72997.1 NAD(P)-dependent oxidoreductase [Pseudomonas chengduensis]SDC10458.1 3-hydroxyisobutyrate dehydrogenase [Pseudomonas chengduensis]
MTAINVGFIGLGLMGHAMAANIQKRGFALGVMAHRNRQPVDDLVGKGAREFANAAELTRAVDVVLLCLPGTAEVCRTLAGEQGVLAGLRPGQIVVDCSTGDPNRTAELAAQVTACGGHYLDTPVNRTPKDAQAGRLNVLAGGDAAVLERVRPVLECFSETIHHLGPLGSGHKAKVIHNFISQGNATILAEAFCTAAKNGIDLAAFAEICSMSGGYSRTFERIIPYVLHGDDSGQQFALANCEKDMRYYTELTKLTPTTGIVSDAVYQTFMLAKALGHGDKYVPRLFDVLGEINGVRVSACPQEDKA